MKLAEAQRIFEIESEILESYIARGLIRKANSGEDEYVDSDFERLGIIYMLVESGCHNDEIHHYLSLDDSTDEVTLLRKWRKNLHGEIRHKQKILDKMDNLIWEKKQEM